MKAARKKEAASKPASSKGVAAKGVSSEPRSAPKAGAGPGAPGKTVASKGFPAKRVGSKNPFNKALSTKASPPKPGVLAARIRQVTMRPEFKHSQFGVEFLDLGTGKVLLAENADKLFVPARRRSW